MNYDALAHFMAYINEKGVSVVDSFNSEDQDFDVEDQIKLIAEFHAKTKGQYFYLSRCINNNLGKEIEEKKVETKRLKRYLETQEGEIYCILRNVIKIAEESIRNAVDANYLELLGRSMKNNEICLGNCLPTNLTRENSISVISLEKCSYDMVENEIVIFFRKLKRKGYKYDWKALTELYCKEEQLDCNSEKYIMSLLSYPSECLRIINRYRQDMESWNKDRFIKHLEKAIKKDGQNLINEVKECMK